MGGRGYLWPTCAALLGAWLGTSGDAEARRTLEALTPDQEIVVAQVVNDTFKLDRAEGMPLALCLDVQISQTPLDEAQPASVRRGGERSRANESKPPGLRGAPPGLVGRLARPWRAVASALACRLDPREPFTLKDARRTPARFVTVRLTSHVASGPLKIDWTEGAAAGPANSRDCTATRTPRGWAVHCGGTWAQ